MHDAASADIQVADFAVAHLSFGEADGGAGGVDERVGKFFEEAIVIWFAREGDGVAGGFGAIAPAVENGEDDWFWGVCVGRPCRVPLRTQRLAAGEAGCGA